MKIDAGNADSSTVFAWRLVPLKKCKNRRIWVRAHINDVSLSSACTTKRFVSSRSCTAAFEARGDKFWALGCPPKSSGALGCVLRVRGADKVNVKSTTLAFTG